MESCSRLPLFIQVSLLISRLYDPMLIVFYPTLETPLCKTYLFIFRSDWNCEEFMVVQTKFDILGHKSIFN